MIRNSFIFLSGIGECRERWLWERGVLTWEEFLGRERIGWMSSGWKRRLDREIEEAERSLELGDSCFFGRRMPVREHWRLYGDLKGGVRFLDIETTGLRQGRDEVTVVGVYDGGEYRAYIRGLNLTREALERELEGCTLLVTFNGTRFDVPFLRARLGVRVEVPHADLCPASRRLGLRGGMKVVEAALGLEREEEIAGVDGAEAVRLWRRWERRGEREALETLVKYNRRDVLNLLPIAEYVYSELRARMLPLDG